jgi:hypothetical protein
LIIDTLKYVAITGAIIAVGCVTVWLIVNALGGQPVNKDDDQ